MSVPVSAAQKQLRSAISALAGQHAEHGHVDVAVTRALCAQAAALAEDSEGELHSTVIACIAVLQAHVISDALSACADPADRARLEEAAALNALLRSYIGHPAP